MKEVNNGTSEGRREMWNDQFYEPMVALLYALASHVSRPTDLGVKFAVQRMWTINPHLYLK